MSEKFIGVPMHFGSDSYGLNFGIQKLVNEFSDLLKEITIVDVIYDSNQDIYNEKLKYLIPISNVCDKIAKITNRIILNGDLPVTIGGDHSIAIGSIAGIAKEMKIGVVWLDAHGDMNTPETTPSGHIHGMPLAVCEGYGDPKLINCFFEGKKVDEKNVVLFGVRDLDKEEKKFIKKTKMEVMSFTDIKRKGLDRSLKNAYDILTYNTDGIHLSIDLDVIDPCFCPGVSMPVLNGLTVEEFLDTFDFFLNTNKIVSIDLVEYNPTYDKDKKTLIILGKLINKIKDKFHRLL